MMIVDEQAGVMGGDEFGMHTQNEALCAVIAAEIAAAGRITFHRFMELALYHPLHGYYAAPHEVIGPRGDYITSPELSPLFGAMVGRQVAEVWALLGRPAPFTVVEVGPGNGTLAADLLRWAARAAPDLRRALHYVLVERGDALRSRQQRLLAGEPGVSWAAALPEAVTGCIVANELLDAFPVHVVRVEGGALYEAYVVCRAGAFAESWGPPSTPAIARYFEALGLLPGEGALAEVNLEAPRWMRAAGAALARGLILTLDYGYPAGRLYAPWRRRGTLLCFSRHTAGDDPFVRVGRQDITAHVDFTTVARAGAEAGLTLAGFTTQREFLTSLGIHEALRPAGGRGYDEEHFARHRAVTELLDPAGLGRVRVLAQTRGLAAAALRGFTGAPNPAEVLFGR
jgi:SAM-dependent MidA family methyltransferase